MSVEFVTMKSLLVVATTRHTLFRNFTCTLLTSSTSRRCPNTFKNLANSRSQPMTAALIRCAVAGIGQLGKLHHASLHVTSCQSAYNLTEHLKDCYQVLNLDPECTSVAEARDAYLKLAKQYHPDSKTPTADVRKFSQAQEAYQAVSADLKARNGDVTREGSVSDEGLDFDIEHTAPQHRQYLEFEGIGVGTPSQRYKHYQSFRVQRAMNSVSERRVERVLLDKEGATLVNLDKKAAKQIKTTNVIDRLVEDLIRDAMNKGQFENLPNKGKPLPDKMRMCPYWDISDHNLNQVLVNNGYAPEWVQAEREIRSELLDLKDNLLKARLKLGPEPLNDFNQNKWQGLLETFTERIQTLNKKVERRNLIVPVLRLQMVHFRPQREIDKVQEEYDNLERTRIINMQDETRRDSQQAERLMKLDSRFFSKIGDKIFQKLFFTDKERV